MAWVKIDDNAPHHRKQLAAGDVACWLWVCGLAYCQKHATDGLIPKSALPFLGCTGWKAAALKLLTAGLWLDAPPDAYQIHDFLKWNDSAATRREKISESAERVARFRAAKRQPVKQECNSVTPLPTGNACNTTPQPIPQPQPQPQPKPFKNDDDATAAGGRGFPLAMSPLRYEKLKQSFRHVGARLRVPHVLHDEFMTKLGGTDPDGRLVAWYLDLDADAERTKEPIPDVFVWLRPKFVEWATSSADDAEFQAMLAKAAAEDAAEAAAKAVRRG